MKLHNCEIRDTNRKWYENYASNRKNRTFLHENIHKEIRNKCGFPQDSILVPILFVTCVNDLPDAPGLLLDPNIFADDNSSFHSEVSITACETTSN